MTALGINVVFADARLVQILTRSCLDLNPAFDCHNPIKYVMLCYAMLCYVTYLLKDCRASLVVKVIDPGLILTDEMQMSHW